MKTYKQIRLFVKTILLIFAGCMVTTAFADPPNTSTTIFPAVPPNISTSGSKPMLMLTASKDHTLFGPMYNDFEDLDGDGVIDVTFKPDFKYFGYFDSTKCYTYSSGVYDPSTTATINNGRYVCGGANQWSGNFLNWATMTRLDIVRKMLYGGQRSTDSTTQTVLQVARLSQDSHSFVKYYQGTDIRDYTPFSTTDLTKTTGSNPNKYSGLSICVRASVNDNGSGSTPIMRMAKGNYRLWATVEGGTVCNWGSGILGPKLSRYYGNAQSYFGQSVISDLVGTNIVDRTGTPAAVLVHEATYPSQGTDDAIYSSVGPDLNIRVSVCVSGNLGEERCQAYGSTTVVYKPVGLLQDFGVPLAGATAARTEFGLITGSYDKNLTAGALRKNMSDLQDEIKPTTGQFCFSSGAACSGTLTDGSGRSYSSTGAIRALDQIVLYGKTNGNYTGSATQLPSQLTNGSLSAWGNPMGEMLVQSLRYYAGLSSTNPSSTSNDANISMPVASWLDPMSETTSTYDANRKTKYGKPICRPLNILALSSSALSFDADDADTDFANLPNRSRGSLSEFTNAVGVAEGINGTVRSVGSVSGGFGETCAGKTVTGLASVTGVCPEAPAVGGSYKIAGASLYANTNKLRTPTSVPPDLPNFALKAKTYAASLAGGVARVEVKIPGTGTSLTNPPKFVYLTPEGLWAAAGNAKRMPGAMLTFASISSSDTHGAFVVTWNDSLFGGDYDMDIAGYLRYDILNPLPPSTKYRLKVTTDIINVGAGWTGSHGFSIIGSDGFDARYLTHRHYSNDSTISGAEGYLCNINNYKTGTADLSTKSLPTTVPPATGRGDLACNVSSGNNTVHDRDSPITLTFEMLGADASKTLRDPLWYAAKYGAFTPSNPTDSNELPDLALEWDARRNDGKSCGGTTGVSCQDGEPDGYFLARRPELLEQQLRNTLETIISTTNSAPAVSSSQLLTGGYKYVASFEPSQNSGSILGYAMNSTGGFSSVANWDTGQKLTTVAPNLREVITNDANTGKAWRTSTTFSSPFTTALLGTGTTALTEAQGNELINYLRGDRTKEKPAGIWRARSISNIMGTVVNSSPWIQPRPNANMVGSLPSGAPSYASFVSAQSARDRLIWTGANDGMLHGFKVDGTDGGTPVISYIPSPMLNRLQSMAQDSTQIIAGMDGSPFTGDVLISNTWKTYLFSSLGRGGRAVFALDVTTPSTLTESNASNIYKWMFSSDDDPDLGYVINDNQMHPVSNQATPIVRMNNDKFAILVPNGLGSTSGTAKLFILYADGSGHIKIPTDGAGSNGLMGVNWADINGDGKADIIYGTDALGRVWKFDVSSATTANWKSAFPSGSGTPVPLFEAYSGTERLAVTTAPVLSYPSFGGIMVGFGTGRSISSGDFPDASKTQRFISVFDRLNWTTPVRPLPNKDLSTFLKRTIARNPADGFMYVDIAGNIPFDKATHDGWYINFARLNSSGTDTSNNELVLSSPRPLGGQIYLKTVKPTSATANNCYANPETTDYLFDPVTGTPTAGSQGTTDVLVNGKTVKVNVIGKPNLDQKSATVLKVKGTKGYWTRLGKDGNEESPPFKIPMRRQWREISGMRTNQ